MGCCTTRDNDKCRICGRKRACCGLPLMYCRDCANARLTAKTPRNEGCCVNTLGRPDDRNLKFIGYGNGGSADNAVRAMEGG